MAETTLLAVVSDLHAGSTVAVCPPRIELDDGGAYEASRGQLWLWQNWLDYWERVKRVRDEHKADLYVLFNGDMVEGDHHHTYQILSRHPGAQSEVVRQVTSIPLDLSPDRVFVVRGTESHVGSGGSGEEGVAKSWRDHAVPVEGDPDHGTLSWWHLRALLRGSLIDCTHHGRTGFRPWTEGNASRLLAQQIFFEHAARHERWPDLAIRSHFHRFNDSGWLPRQPVRVVQTPAWQLSTSYVHKRHPEGLADIGGLIVLLREGEVPEVRPVLYEPSRGPIWTE